MRLNVGRTMNTEVQHLKTGGQVGKKYRIKHGGSFQNKLISGLPVRGRGGHNNGVQVGETMARGGRGS